MGVTVNETNRENNDAKAIVKPNSLKKAPAIPDINATGTYTTISHKVIAMAARPISLRPSIAALTGSFS
jgi:hypothetical protein